MNCLKIKFHVINKCQVDIAYAHKQIKMTIFVCLLIKEQESKGRKKPCKMIDFNHNAVF